VQFLNIGNSPFIFPQAFVFKQNPTQFNLLSAGESDCADLLNRALAPTSTCSLNVQFIPTSDDAFADTLTLGPGLQVALSGNATETSGKHLISTARRRTSR
jgi:hypothetical protein